MSTRRLGIGEFRHTIASLIGVLGLLTVPQIRSVVIEHSRPQSLDAFVFYGVLALILLFYALAGAAMARAPLCSPRQRPDWLGPWEWLNWVASRLRTSRHAVTVPWIGLVSAMLMLAVSVIRGEGVALERFPVLSRVGLTLAILSVWFLVHQRQASPGTNPFGSAVGVFLGALTFGLYFGELVWWAAGQWNYVHLSVYTTWAIIHVLWTVLGLAVLFDRLLARGYVSSAFYGVVVVALLFAIGEFRSDSLEFHVVKEADLEPRQNWTIVDHLSQRVQELGTAPAVIITCSGGGSRAAIHSTLILEHLRTQESGYRDARGKAMRWLDHVVLYSTVSGGSLAAATHVSERSFAPRRPPRHTAFADDEEGGERFESPVVDSVCCDFLAPMLRAGLTAVPGSYRGDYLREFWGRSEAVTRLEGSQLTWRRRPGSESKPSKPAMLINAHNLETQARLMVGFPPIAPGLLGQRTAVNASYSTRGLPGPAALNDLVGADLPDMTLAEAVRLSSNFPFAFRPIDLRTASGLLTTTLDGGISDNTGVDSVFYLLAAIRELVEKGDEGAPRDFLTHLRKHGLIVLEISSDPEPPDGHRPSPSSGNHLDALGTLIGSLFANANRAATFHRVGIEEVVTGHFDKTEDDKLLSSVPLVLWHTFRLKADQLHQFENVPTTWSLGPVGKRCVSKMVLKDLKERWAPRSANLRNELTFLCAVEKQALRVGRLPLLLKRSGVLAEEIGRNIAQQSEGARNLQELLHRFRWVDSAKSEMASRLAAEATKYVEQKRKLTERERVSLETVAALSRDNLEKGIERWRKLYRTGAASD